ncbi:MAG TPA: hypothetical protein VLX92_32590 [Kofleriaceae bacterium]|nr:hypothetical protein [Kofleriaceae bacterium]
MATDSKLPPNSTWLFALATLAVAIGVTYLIPHVVSHHLTFKATCAVYLAIYGAGATLATFVSRAGIGRVIGSFAVASIGLGIFYYVVVARSVASAVDSLGGSEGAASIAGAAIGYTYAAGFTLSAIAAGISGALFGNKLRNRLGVRSVLPGKA